VRQFGVLQTGSGVGIFRGAQLNDCPEISVPTNEFVMHRRVFCFGWRFYPNAICCDRP